MSKDASSPATATVSMAWRDLHVYGYDASTDYQNTFANYPLKYLLTALGCRKRSRVQILRDFEGLVYGGQMVLVLGKPGSGCTTLLKTLAGKTYGLHVDDSGLNYRGLPPNVVHSRFRGDCTYQAEHDIHFPHLTVDQTLQVAVLARSPKERRRTPAKAVESLDTIIPDLGLSQALHVKVGNDMVPGISGGERKRTSIAEILASGSSIQFWDNSTRGLDSVNALSFATALRQRIDTTGSMAFSTLYQCPEDVYRHFDKVLLLYDGHQIFFGDTDAAKAYFMALGFLCPDRMTTSDFLTSITNPLERKVQEALKYDVPQTPQEFSQVWRSSSQRADLLLAIDSYCETYPLNHNSAAFDTKGLSLDGGSTVQHHSPYVISYAKQVHLCIVRNYQRLRNDLAPPLSSIIGNTVLSIVLGSMFYAMPENTSSFYGRGVSLFFIVLTNTCLGAFEGVQLWDHRPIVEKHFQYAFYRPSTEAVASLICDLPNKILLTICFNVPYYFLANMRRTLAAFFIFYLFAFVSLLAGSMLFRTIGAMSKTTVQSIAPGATFILMLIIYTGFVLPIPDMHPWFRWFAYLNPIGYAFESLMINEFSGREFECHDFVPQGPSYQALGSEQRTCAIVGAMPQANMLSGDEYLIQKFRYAPENLWRNLGIIIAITIGLCCIYLLATEFNPSEQSRGEILTFCEGNDHKLRRSKDLEATATSEFSPAPAVMAKAEDRVGTADGDIAKERTLSATFIWNSLCYEVNSKKDVRQLLKDVEGWVKPGTLTALMGPSGAGKTTLLNVLARRASVGVVSGEMMTEAKFQDVGFARKVGYAQQQDIHLATATAREALIFNARLRQPAKYSDQQKLAYVDGIITTLDMSNFADAIIGTPGYGLNAEQRKRVTIGVELAARPELLLFLDEPTSGLDSNTAWSICQLLRRLADDGQTILCTIHQPSAANFMAFDRLLVLIDGRSAYFGDIGPNCSTLIDYFERHGAKPCQAEENPAEWLLTTCKNLPPSEASAWADIWQDSDERRAVESTIKAMEAELCKTSSSCPMVEANEFATSFRTQLMLLVQRNFTNDWRIPSYLYSKILLILGAALFNGFSFYHSPSSLQGVQNQLFSVFLVLIVHNNLVQLILPHFLSNRCLYELRERPSRTYSWITFILANILSEIPWQTALAVIHFVSWYYPNGMYRTAIASHQLHERSFLMFSTNWSLLMLSSTLSQMLGTLVPDEATGINISALLWSLSMIFCGVLVSPTSLPRFWIFMYRVSPLTYITAAMASSGIAGVSITCARNEIVQMDPPTGMTCESFLTAYLRDAGGTLLNPTDMHQCQLCPVSTTDDVLATLGVYATDGWRNLGISLVYTAVNIAGSLLLYWIFRVPKIPKAGVRS